MKNHHFEKQLQDASAPPPDPHSRLLARRAAVAEFERLQCLQPQVRTPRPWWGRSRLWNGLAAAGVALVGLSLVWLMPAEQRYPVPLEAAARVGPATTPTADDAVPAAAPSQEAEPIAAQGSPREVPPLTTRDRRPQPDAGVAAPTVRQAGAEAPTSPASAISLASQTALVPQNLAAPAAAPAPVPAASITGDEIRRQGVVNIADSLAMVAQAPSGLQTATGVPGLSEASVRSSEFIANTIANLRGMDPAYGARTLTLVDGRRMVALQPSGDRFERFEINPLKRTADEPVSTFSIDVDTVSYSFARRQLGQGVLPPADSIRIEEMINYFDYAWPASNSRERPFRPTVTVSDSPWNEGRKLVHIGIKGYEMPARSRPDVNLVLLLDVSGSMNSPDKLPLAQRSMALLLDSLKPTDTVAIAVYAGAAGEVLAPTPVREKEKILTALNSLRPGGATAGAAGIRLAYELARRSFREDGVNRILLATDGDFNVGISDTGELKRFVERERESGVFLSVLGFGQGNYRDEMAQALAQNGNGVAAYIDTLNEARKVLVEQAGAALFTIASDVKLQVEFNPATVAEYRLVGYETRALNREDFNNDRVDAGDVGAGHTVTAIYEIAPAGAPGQLIDERRYGRAEATARGRTGEYGFLKIRYKLPGNEDSELLEQPIAVDAGVPRALRQDVEFATAVAGFAQLLRGGRYTGRLTYEDVLSQAQRALGEDPHGYRAEFVQLVRTAVGVSRRE